MPDLKTPQQPPRRSDRRMRLLERYIGYAERRGRVRVRPEVLKEIAAEIVAEARLFDPLSGRVRLELDGEPTELGFNRAAVLKGVGPGEPEPRALKDKAAVVVDLEKFGDAYRVSKLTLAK